MIAADEFLLTAAGVIGAARCANESAAAMRAHVVVRLDLVRRTADDQDRVIADVVGDETADFGNFFDAADVLPHLCPQLIALGLGILPGNIGFHR